MSNKVYYISREGVESLRKEMQELKSVRVKEVAERIESAKALGDLKENAEYHSAKDEMGLLQSRIREIDEILKNVQIIDETQGSKDVRIGSTIEVESRNGVKTYKIVGSAEADPAAGLISNESPMGRAFLGHTKGDLVMVETPGGVVQYTIIEIK